jgi:cytochrome-b5 reductase
MSKHIDSLEVGETLDIMGPVGAFRHEPNKFDNYALIAGGSGITPIIQVNQDALQP